ncbi:MAG: hypothetical protein KDC14_09630 [Planctomycetes bacterium]|nr:hypothetical protein [Planctomycetota bacterium]
MHRTKSHGARLGAFCLAGLCLAAPVLAQGNDEPDDLHCTEFDRYETLTPNDTLSLITAYHNPEQARGFVVVYVVDAVGDAVASDNLIGSLMVINGIERFEYSVNPVDFRATVEAGSPTDVDGDGVRDLDATEYETCPDGLLVPRFFGQTNNFQLPAGQSADLQGSLILLDLNSGRDFDTTVDFLVYNDNEEVFSGEYTFDCWDNPRLVDISGAFRQNFLASATDHDPSESIAGRETGWFRFEGAVANSVATSVANPAIYGVYVERIGDYAVADLPFESGSRPGHVLPRSIFGDNSQSGGFAGGTDSVRRRRPGSLLVYPEFNNTQGELTLLTVSNVSPTDEVRAHFVYYGKYGPGAF